MQVSCFSRINGICTRYHSKSGSLRRKRIDKHTCKVEKGINCFLPTWSRIEPLQVGKKLLLSAKPVLPRRLPLASRSGPQETVSGDKTIASRISGWERAGGAAALAGTPHSAGGGISEVPAHLESALCAPPGRRVANLRSRLILGPFGASSSQHMLTLELVLQKRHASFRITSSPTVQRIAAETSSRVSLTRHMSQAKKA